MQFRCGATPMAGSLLVRSSAGTSKWVMPDAIGKTLRPSNAAPPIFERGEKIHVWSESRKDWLLGVVQEVFVTDTKTEGFEAKLNWKRRPDMQGLGMSGRNGIVKHCKWHQHSLQRLHARARDPLGHQLELFRQWSEPGRAVGCKVLQVLEERDKLDELEVVPMDEPAASGLLGATHSQLTQESPALATMLPSGLDERWAQEMQIPLEHLKEAIRLLQDLNLARLEQHQALERKRQEVALAWSEIGCEPPADIQASLLQCTSLEDLEELQCSAKRCHAAGSALTLEQLDQLLARAEEIPDCEGGQDFEKLPVDFVEETMPSQESCFFPDMEIPRKAEEDDAEKNPEGEAHLATPRKTKRPRRAANSIGTRQDEKLQSPILARPVSGTKARKRPKAKAKAKCKARPKAKAKATKAAQAKASRAKPKPKPRPSRAEPRHGAPGGFRKRISLKGRRPSAAKPSRKTATTCDVNDWEGDSLQGSPNPSEVEQLLGKISRQLHLEKSHVAGAVRLFNEGSTLPFIARYRKEQTGSMKEEDLRRVEREMSRVKDLEKKRGRVALALNRGKHLNPSLVESLLQAETVEEIEGLWAPFKAKRQTRAQKAKEQGLEPLAKILEVAAKEPGGVEEEAAEAAQQFVSPEVPDVQSALRAARDILAEQLAHRADLRQLARQALESKVLCRARRKPGADEERRKSVGSFL
eukprot:g22280.t1